MIKSIIEDEDLFPIFVASGFDVYGLSEPLYFTDGIWMYPNGRLETEDDLEDLLGEYYEKNKGKVDFDYIDQDEELNFSEANVGKTYLEFSEIDGIDNDDLISITNNINFALIAYLDELPKEHIHEVTLLNAAISAGHFAANHAENLDFKEKVERSLSSDKYIYDHLFSEYKQAEQVTLRALGYLDSRDSLQESIRAANNYIKKYNPTPQETVKVIKLATGLEKDDLAKTAIRLKIGKMDYRKLPEASMLSHYAFMM